MMQKVGDRSNPTISIKDCAFCVNANPMSDRQQFVIEIEFKNELQKEQIMDNELKNQLKGKKVRIRTITEREGFRLMGVDDADIDKIQNCGVSSTAQRKLAGNSIVVDTLFHIFRKMFIEQENENQQLSLF